MSSSIVITGVSTGIGRATAEHFLGLGFRVYGSVRKADTGAELAKLWGGSFHPLVFDVTDEAAVARASDEVKTALAGEPLAALVNNAGIAVAGPLETVSTADLRRQLETNVVGPHIVTRAFLPLLGAREGFSGVPGRIVNISSVAGRISFPLMGPYAASKHALEAYSDALRRELLVWGIDVIVLGPGAVKTPIWDKAEQTDFSHLDATRYEEASRAIQAFAVNSAKTGLEGSVIAQAVERAVNLRKPKARYVLTRNFLGDWWFPVHLPKRLFDKALAQGLKLTRR
ncbi:MAG: SDR family oxidoreductase [Spirochaetales bacterium]